MHERMEARFTSFSTLCLPAPFVLKTEQNALRGTRASMKNNRDFSMSESDIATP